MATYHVTQNDEDWGSEVSLHLSIVTVVVHDCFGKRDICLTGALHIVISHTAAGHNGPFA